MVERKEDQLQVRGEEQMEVVVQTHGLIPGVGRVV